MHILFFIIVITVVVIAIIVSNYYIYIYIYTDKILKTWINGFCIFAAFRKRGWRFVGNVIKRKRLAVNLRDGSLLPDPALNCEAGLIGIHQVASEVVSYPIACQELDESDLNELEYARYISALLEEEGVFDRKSMDKIRRLLPSGNGKLILWYPLQ